MILFLLLFTLSNSAHATFDTTNKVLFDFENYTVIPADHIWFDNESKEMSAKYSSEISHNGSNSVEITYTKLPPGNVTQSFGFRLPDSLTDLRNYSAISIHVYGICTLTANLWIDETPMLIGIKKSTEKYKWNTMTWELNNDVDLSEVKGISFDIIDETGITGTFYLDDIELITSTPLTPTPKSTLTPPLEPMPEPTPTQPPPDWIKRLSFVVMILIFILGTGIFREPIKKFFKTIINYFKRKIKERKKSEDRPNNGIQK